MKNITLSADENLIEQARKAAADQHTTLNAAFASGWNSFPGASSEPAASTKPWSAPGIYAPTASIPGKN